MQIIFNIVAPNNPFWNAVLPRQTFGKFLLIFIAPVYLVIRVSGWQ